MKILTFALLISMRSLLLILIFTEIGCFESVKMLEEISNVSPTFNVLGIVLIMDKGEATTVVRSLLPYRSPSADTASIRTDPT